MIRFENASVVYPGGVHALRNLTLEIPDGQMMVIVGLWHGATWGFDDLRFKGKRYPFPVPNGWFVVAEAADLAPGEVRALYVRPESSTGLITEAVVELNPGDRVELREGY